MQLDNDRIIRRIKALLALAEDKANVNESHSALLQAQRMMVEYGVDATELTDDEKVIEVLERNGSDFKRLYWYERRLAGIVASNFRCKHYYESRYVDGKSQIQRRIMFMGTEEDVELATAMYKLVVSAIDFYTLQHIKKHGFGVRQHTQTLKNDYMLGFIDGLERKFEEQIQSQEWALVLVIPKEVEDKYSEIVTGKALNYNVPQLEWQESYQQGYKDGNEIDYKKETINVKE